MKKILAIAVATAIAAPAMADMTIGGTVAAGWSGDSNTAEGFGVDTASISISGSEALDNGMKVSGAFGFENGQKAKTVLGTGGNLTISGDFGAFAITSQKSGAYTESYGSADNFVGEFSTESVGDVISYTAPAMGPVTLVVDTGEGNDASIGTGAGTYDMQVTALVKAGDFSGRVAFKSVDAGKNRTRIGGTYNLGVVSVGAAFQSQGDDKYSSAGVVLPLGATTLSASVAKKETATTTLNGTSFAVAHKLSSNVTASVKYNDYDVNATTQNKATTALVTLAF